jgi:DNA-binding transcriptional LysR family regulator
LAGRTLEPMARRLLSELDMSVLSISDLGAQQRGQISVASIPSAVVRFLPRVIQKFHQRYPLIALRVHDLSPLEGLESVLRGEVEFGINMVGATETDVVFSPLMDDPYVLACRRKHPLAKKKIVKWTDLSEHTLIRIGRPNSGNRAFLDGALAKANLHINWHYGVNNLATALALVEAGVGASVVPHLAAPIRSNHLIVTRPLRSPEVMRTVGIVERRKGRLSAAAAILRDMIVREWTVT